MHSEAPMDDVPGVRLPPARSGDVSPEFVRLLDRYGASPRLLHELSGLPAKPPSNGAAPIEAVPVSQPEASPPPPPQLGAGASRTRYAKREVSVTADGIATRTTLIPMNELSAFTRELDYGYSFTKVGIICGIVEMAIAIPLAVAYGSPLMLMAGVLIAGGLAISFLVDVRRNPRRMELVATHRGRRVVLLQTSDRAEFERLRRALIRATEGHGDTLWWEQEYPSSSERAGSYRMP